MSKQYETEHSVWNPEKMPVSEKQLEGESEFLELISGMHDLSSVNGRVTSVQFFEDILQEMENQGLAVNELRFNILMRDSFGEKQALLDTLSQDDFEAYPSHVQSAILAYLI